MNSYNRDDDSFQGNTEVYFEIVDNLLEGCQILDSDWRYVFINKSLEKQIRMNRENIIGKTMMEVYPGIEETPMFSVLMESSADNLQRQIKNMFVFPDKRKAWFDLKIIPMSKFIYIFSLETTEFKSSIEEKEMMAETLSIIDDVESWEDFLRIIIKNIKKWSACEAVGIRIKNGLDFPYFVTSGFSDEFVRLENNLCNYDEKGAVIYDEKGNPVLDCMCGNILNGKYDSEKSFFTTDGSFWSNCTTDLLATTTEKDRQSKTRNRCNGSGYESVALIPIRTDKKTYGLLQLNDREKGKFTPEMITRFRRTTDIIAVYLSKKQTEESIIHLNMLLKGIRNVNQLIVREKDSEKLIQSVCDLLTENRGFNFVSIVLTDKKVGKILNYRWAGSKLDFLIDTFEKGVIPKCIKEFIVDRNTKILIGDKFFCNDIKIDVDMGSTLLPLEHDNKIYGFMVTCIPYLMKNDAEEQDLMIEVAMDIAYALSGIETEKEKKQSQLDLNDAQEQMRQTQKLEAIGLLAGGIAHDYNNILMVQMGYCDIMMEELKGNDQLMEDLIEIRSSAERAASLTRQLLIFGRKQPIMPVVLDLNTIIKNTEKMLKRLIGEDIDLIVNLKERIWKVKIDPGHVEQVVLNLAVNARDAMPKGGKLSIETDNVFLDNEYTFSHIETIPGRYVMLAVSDNGCGMDQNTIEHIFDPFFTTKEIGKGTGLGLSTVYGIVKQSGGNIWVYSEKGNGTTFKVYFPIVESGEIEVSLEETSLIIGNGELVLVVEDEPTLLKIIYKMLTALGYQVEVSANADEAISLVEKEKLNPDVLITDVIMPNISGKLLVDRLKRTIPDLKYLFMSGYTDNSIVDHGVLKADIPFLQKPFNINTLSFKLRSILDI